MFHKHVSRILSMGGMHGEGGMHGKGGMCGEGACAVEGGHVCQSEACLAKGRDMHGRRGMKVAEFPKLALIHGILLSLLI